MPDSSFSSFTGKLSSAYFVVWLNVISIRFGSVYYLNKCTENKNAESQNEKRNPT